MGFGKTVQVACCLAAGLYGRRGRREPAAAPVLVLCPPSLVQNWVRELNRWGPFVVEVMGPAGANGGGRARTLQRLQAGMADVLVASRGLVRGPDEEGTVEGLQTRAWGCIVMDEVHQARNPKSQLHAALAALDSPRKLGLTGTPW